MAIRVPASGTSVAPRTFVAGRYYDAGHGSTIGAGSLDLDLLVARSFPVTQSAAFDRIGIVVVSAATAGGVVRLGIYADSGGMPGSLIVQTAALDVASGPGLVQATIAQTLAAGMYWLAGVAQVAAPSVRRFVSSSAGDPAVGTDDPVGDAPFPFLGYSRSGVSGALPATFAADDVKTNICPRVFLRAA